MKLPTIFFGASAYVLPIIEYLNSDFDLKLVITTEQNPTDAVPKYCLAKNIQYICVKTLNDENLISKIQTFNSQFAVLADFALLVPQNIIDIFPKGIINIHPSLLPEYRGPTPGFSAILDGKKSTGISIMLLDKELDHGPLIGQTTTDIKADDTSASLYPRLFKEGGELLRKVLPDYLGNKIKPTPQDHSKVTFTQPHLTKKTGFVEFNELTTLNDKLLDRKIRAFFPWPTLWTRYSGEGKLNGKIIKFLPNPDYYSEDKKIEDEIILQQNKSTSVDDTLFLIQVEGKKPQTYKDFLNGYPEEKDWIEKIK